MDSKMDTGLRKDKMISMITPIHDLSADQVCWVIDGMVAREVCD
jgi:hypothetical protein